MKQTLHLGPFRGLDPTNIAEEVGIQGTSMRGGYNVEVVDSEWWVRQGLGTVSERLGSIPWRFILHYHRTGTDDLIVLASHNYIVAIDTAYSEDILTPGVVQTTLFQDISIPYASAGQFDVTASTGARVMTVNIDSGVVAEGQIFILANDLYRITTVIDATHIEVDRPFPGVNNVTNNRAFYDPVIPLLTNIAFASDLDGGLCLFDQTVAHVADALGYTHVEVEAGVYAVLVQNSGVAAVRIDDPTPSQAVIRNFVRQTQDATPGAVDNNAIAPVVYKDRLFIEAEPPNGINDRRTIWYSRALDLMQWHTGLQDLGGTPNYITFQGNADPISGFAVSGEALVVHRRVSQELLQPYGNGFRVTHAASNIGFWPRSRFVPTHVGYIGWTMYGPAISTDGGMSIMFPQIEMMLRSFGYTARMDMDIGAVLHDEARRRVYFFLGQSSSSTTTGDRRIVRHQDAEEASPSVVMANEDGLGWLSRRAALVVDYIRREAWLEDHVAISGGGPVFGQLYVSRFDGTILALSDGWSGKDYVPARTNELDAVDAAVETNWLDLGSVQRKLLQKLYVTLRALDSNEDVDPVVDPEKFNPLRVSNLWDATTDTLHLGTLEVMTDQKEDTVRASFDLNVLTSEMLGRSLEGNRQLPLMQYIATPRAAGRSFKFKLKNALSAAATAAGHKKGHFRLVDIVVEFEVEENTRAAGLTGDS